MQRVAVLCLLLGALAAAAAGQERGNCEKYCDVSVNGTAPPAEWCYCFAGEVARNGKTKLKRLREITKEKSGKTRQTSDDKQEKSEHGTRQSGLYGPVEYSMIFQGASVCSSGQQLQFQSPYQGFVAVRDQAKCGDTFLVYDNGVLLGSTSDPGCYTAVDCEAGVNGGDSFDRACISRGCFLLAPNVQHNITIVLSFSPYGSSEVGADVAYYADSPGADCSQSAQALAPLGPLENLALNQCTSLPVVAGTSPCPPFQQLPTPVGCPTFPVE